MKRRLMLAAMSLILTVTLSVTSMNTVAEASPKMSPTEENLEITINSFLESDGAVAEELTDEMLKTFLETPLDFLRVIDTYPLDKQELLLSRIANVAVGMPDEERLSFEDIIYSADETTPGISLLETYYSEALEATPPQNSVSNLPKYDMESVNQIVKAYLASDSEGNEAFYNYLSNVYSAEPELMESVMMNYSDSEIQTLAKDLAALYREDSDLLERFQCDGRLSAAVLEAIDSSIEETSAMTNIAPYAVYTPKITSFSYTKKIEVGTPVPLSIKLTETSGTSSARTYTVKVFCTRSGKEWQVATTMVLIISAEETIFHNNPNFFDYTKKISTVDVDGRAIYSVENGSLLWKGYTSEIVFSDCIIEPQNRIENQKILKGEFYETVKAEYSSISSDIAIEDRCGDEIFLDLGILQNQCQ